MIRNKRASTLIEVVLAITIFSIVAMPLLTLYLQSFKTDKVARQVLDANYMAQDYIEQLYPLKYKDALDAQAGLEARGDYYITATIEPYGTAGDLFAEPYSYAHLIFYANGSMIAVMPDGEIMKQTTAAMKYSFDVTNGRYSFKAGSQVLSGSAKKNNCALIVNTTKLGQDYEPEIELKGHARAVAYCTNENYSKLKLSGTGDASSIVHKGVIDGKTSLIRVNVQIFDKDRQLIAKKQAAIAVKNW